MNLGCGRSLPYVIIIVNIAYNVVGDDEYGDKKFFKKYSY